jgi:hypothetical protein
VCRSLDRKSTSFTSWKNRQYHNSEVRDEVFADTLARYESRQETEAALLKEHGLSIHKAEDTEAIIELLERTEK